MDTSNEFDNKIKIRLSIPLLLAAILSMVFYYLTCFRTFTWWDSAEYSVAALTLGVPHPPGSLLTVIAGWMATRLPFGVDKFFTLNLLMSVIAALTVYIVGRVALSLYYQSSENDINSGFFSAYQNGAFIGALTFGVSITTWYYAIRFTPYMTTGLMSAFIIMAMLAWQRRSADANAHLWLGLVTLLFGLDFSIHRTNLLMLPALFIWVWIFNPKAFLAIKNWLYGTIGLVIGLALQLLIMPIAARQPFMNFNDPSSWSRFWGYLTLKQYGGGWLINIFPRKAPFLSVQVADYLRIFGDNFANNNLMYAGFLPLIVGLAGLVILFKRNWRMGLGLITLFLFASLGAIIYFNLPANYFRSIDRHYMPSFVIFGILIAYGAAVLAKYANNIRFSYWGLGGIITILLLLMPGQAINNNYSGVDGSKAYFAYDTARNYLASLPNKAIIFTQADIDTYPLWCLQVAEKMRPDITVCNIGLMNTPWFIKQIRDNDKAFPVRLNDNEIAALSPIPWQDTTITLPVTGNCESFGLSSDLKLPDSVNLMAPPTIQGKYVLVQDQMILKTIEASNWDRPICFSTMLPDQTIRWLKPYLRLEGLFWRLVPVRSDETEKALLRKNLIENYSYRGFTASNIRIEEPTKWVGYNYCSSFLMLSSMEYGSGDTLGCRKTMGLLDSLISPERLELPPPLREALANGCR
jgi:hypothetical protein